MVTFQPNNMGQLYVKWSINSKIYVSAYLVGRQTYCTNSTLWSGGEVDDVVAVDGIMMVVMMVMVMMTMMLMMVAMVMTIRKILIVPAEEGTLASRCSNRRGFPV